MKLSILQARQEETLLVLLCYIEKYKVKSKLLSFITKVIAEEVIEQEWPNCSSFDSCCIWVQ